MRNSDITIHKAIVHNVSSAGVYVRIPSLLGSSEIIALHEPSVSDYKWPPTVGDQVLVAVEGDNFNRVYTLLNINNQPDNIFEVADGSVTTVKIANDAVTSAKIAADAVGSSEIAGGAVGASELASDAVTTAKILDANVTTAKIADGAVTEAKLGLTELKLRASYTFSAAASDYILWDTEDADASGFITVSSDTITVPSGKTGLYSFALKGVLTGGDSENSLQFSSWRVNDQVVAMSQDVCSPGGQIFHSANVYLEASNTVKFNFVYGYRTGSHSTATFRLWMTRIMD